MTSKSHRGCWLVTKFDQQRGTVARANPNFAPNQHPSNTNTTSNIHILIPIYIPISASIPYQFKYKWYAEKQIEFWHDPLGQCYSKQWITSKYTIPLLGGDNSTRVQKCLETRETTKSLENSKFGDREGFKPWPWSKSAPLRTKNQWMVQYQGQVYFFCKV